jgi:hydroxyacylglutathione hydrolase
MWFDSRTKILLLLLLALCALATTFFYFRSKVEFHLVETGKIGDGLFAVRGNISNMFLIEARKSKELDLTGAGPETPTFIAIDACDDVSLVEKALETLKIDRLKVESVFLTHSDRDHRAALDLFANARIYMSQEEEQMVTGKTPRAVHFLYNEKLPRAHTLLEDGEIIDIRGRKIRCLLTGGHTPGHMCYLVDDKFLFSGDLFNLSGGRVIPFFWKYTMDLAGSKLAIAKLARAIDLPKVSLVLTSHSGLTHNAVDAFEGWK